MKLFKNLRTSILLLAIYSCQSSESDGYYIEKDGLIEIELENHYQIPEGWELRKENEGYTGEGYLQWVGEGINYDHNVGVLEFNLHIENEGDYHFRIFNRHDHEGDYTEDNDIFTKTNDGEWIKTFSHYSHRMWGWDTKFEVGHLDFISPPKVHFKKGVNSFYIGGRSPGFKMDKIHFFHADLIADDYDTNPDNPFVLDINQKSQNHED